MKTQETTTRTMVDRLAPHRAGGQHRLVHLGYVVGLHPSYVAHDGSLRGPWVERQPLGFGDHRLLDRVALTPVDLPPHLLDDAAELGLLTSQWYEATCVCWARGPDGPQHVVERTALICAWHD